MEESTRYDWEMNDWGVNRHHRVVDPVHPVKRYGATCVIERSDGYYSNIIAIGALDHGIDSCRVASEKRDSNVPLKLFQVIFLYPIQAVFDPGLRESSQAPV